MYDIYIQYAIYYILYIPSIYQPALCCSIVYTMRLLKKHSGVFILYTKYPLQGSFMQWSCMQTRSHSSPCFRICFFLFLTMTWTSFHVYECGTNWSHFTAFQVPICEAILLLTSPVPGSWFWNPLLKVSSDFPFYSCDSRSQLSSGPMESRSQFSAFSMANLVSIVRADARLQESCGCLWGASAWMKQPSLLHLYWSRCLFLCIRLSGDGVWRSTGSKELCVCSDVQSEQRSMERHGEKCPLRSQRTTTSFYCWLCKSDLICMQHSFLTWKTGEIIMEAGFLDYYED